MSANANINPYEFGEDYIEEFMCRYFEERGSKSLWNETQLKIILEATVPMIETIIETLKDFPGSAIYLLQLFKEVNRSSKESGKEDKSICEIMSNISESEGNTKLKLLTSRFWPLHHLCVGKFWRYEFHLEDYQARHVLSKEQKQEAHRIIDEHLEKAITELSKLENKPCHPLLELPEKSTTASPEFFPSPGKRKRESPSSITEDAKERRIEPNR